MKEDNKLNTGYRKTKHFCLAKDLDIKADSIEEESIFHLNTQLFFTSAVRYSAELLAEVKKPRKVNLKMLRPSPKKSALHKDLKDV